MVEDFYLDIRDNDPKNLWAEGSCSFSEKPTKEFIERELKKEGWESNDISIYYDDFQYIWRFVCQNIVKVKEDRDKHLEDTFNIDRKSLCQIQHSLNQANYSVFFGIGSDKITIYYENKKYFQPHIKTHILRMLVNEGVDPDQIEHTFCGQMEAL